jgi:hypothetical protein
MSPSARLAGCRPMVTQNLVSVKQTTSVLKTTDNHACDRREGLDRKPNIKIPLGRTRHKWEDNIKVPLK